MTGHNLPSDYQEVEYIESSGTQWIDTGLKCGIGYRIKFKIYTVSSSNRDQTIIGGMTNINAEAIYFGITYNSSYKSIYRGYNSQWFDWNNTIEVSNYYEVETIIRNGTQKVILNGVEGMTGTLSISGTGTNNMSIFSSRGGSMFALVKLYYMKIYDSNDNLIRDFVPCYRKSDNVIGLYDLVNDTLYTNAGTGTFNKGKNIEPPSHIITKIYNNGEEYYIDEYQEGWKPGANTLVYLKLDGDVKDYSGNNNNGTIMGTVDLTKTIGSKKYAEFNNGEIDLTTLPISGDPTFTHSVWIKLSSNGISVMHHFGRDANNSRSFIWIGYPNDHRPLQDRYGRPYDMYLGSAIPTSRYGTRKYCVYVHDGTSNKLYINGELYGEGSGSLNIVSGYNKKIGFAKNTYGAYGMSECIIENKARTAQEISDYYNQTKSLYGIN